MPNHKQKRLPLNVIAFEKYVTKKQKPPKNSGDFVTFFNILVDKLINFPSQQVRLCKKFSP